MTNWLPDIYERIDAEQQITLLAQREYRDEIHWAYRLGYLTRDEYYQALEYLDTQMIYKNEEADRLHAMRMEQFEYDRNLLVEKELYKADIRKLFLQYVRYDKSKHIYYYDCEEVETAVTGNRIRDATYIAR